jgi:aspartate kinase
MALIVQKFGGTSVGSIERIRNVAWRVAKWQAAGHRLVVVPSAMAGETNRLLTLADGLQEHPGPARTRRGRRHRRAGQRRPAGHGAAGVGRQGAQLHGLAGQGADGFGLRRARIVSIDEVRLRQDLENGCVAVVAGFQGVDKDGNITTLGRGGSDTSAVALAAALGADECQIYTDVDGVYTTDPRIVPEARRLKTVSFEEMLEMASAGSKVLQIRSVEFAGKYKVPTRVLSSLTDPKIRSRRRRARARSSLSRKTRTWRWKKQSSRALPMQRDEAKITVQRRSRQAGIAYAILGPIADAGINVDVIVQNVGHDGTTDLSFTLGRADMAKAMRMLNDQVKPAIKCREITGDDRMAKVSVVGSGMRSHAGIAAKMFRTLAEEGINIQMISTSEIKISVVVDEKYAELACASCTRPSTRERLASENFLSTRPSLADGGRISSR